MRKIRGSALASAWMGTLFALGIALCASAPALAQVEWVTSLSPPPTSLELNNHVAAGASDGATYSAAIANDGGSFRVRLARISPTGATQWVRWGAGSYSLYSAASRLPLHVHSDNSATIVYQDPNAAGSCVQNFTSAGDSRSRTCYGGNNTEFRTTLAADGDLYIASDYQRTVRKVSTSGVLRWSKTDVISQSTPVYSAGIDVLGNYFEVQNNKLHTWSRIDGSTLNDVALAELTLPSYAVNGKETLPRAGGDLVVLRGTAELSNAVVARVARYGTNGASIWVKDVIFPEPGNAVSVALAAADGDAIYVIRSPYGEGDSQVAKLSATGAVIWQRHYATVRRVIDSPLGLTAIRSGINSANTASDSVIFLVSPVDGTLGAPTIFSRSDQFVPSDWFAVTGGVLATFQQSVLGFAPSAALQATSVFIGLPPSGSSSRWVAIAEARLPSSISQGDCLMPRLPMSSPSSDWARATATPFNGPSDWIKVTPASGAIAARTAQSAAGCGAPITADGGRIIVSPNNDRLKKINATGGTVWQTSSTVNPQQSSPQPIEFVAANGEITYLAGSVLGRASATGAIVFETETGRAYARYLAVDSANNAWFVSRNASNEGLVGKISASGALQWSTAVDAPACNDVLMAARLTAADEMLVATQSCGEGRVFKINAAGQIAWQRIVSGSAQRPTVELYAFNVDSSGNVYAGGCASSGNAQGVNSAALVASWSSSGSERWQAQADLIGSAPECVSSIAIDGGSNVFAAVSSSNTSKAPVLWSFTSNGVERWRHSGVLSSPFATGTELRVDATGKLIALGEAPPNVFGPREATLRRINVAGLGSPLKLKILEVPTAAIGYRAMFPVRIGLRTAADAIATATAVTTVSLGLQTGSGSLDGSLACSIAIGASDCTVSDTRYDVVETGVTLSASADGFATVVSPSISFNTAATITTIAALNPAPYNAFSTIRVRAATQGPPPVLNQGVSGNLGGPYSPTYPSIDNCTTSFPPGALIVNECDLLVRTEAMPLNAQFSTYSSNYSSSAATPTSLPVTPVATTLQVTNDPTNTYIIGDRVRFRVALLTPNGFNATQFVSTNALSITGGTCGPSVLAGSLANQFSGSYITCDVASTASAALSASISFTGNLDLLAAGPANQTVALNAGAVLRGNGSFPTGVTVCSPTAGVTCGFSSAANSEWQCSGPTGMSGQVFFVPSIGSGQLYFPTSPIQFNNVTGLTNYTAAIPYNYFSSFACNFDVDGDGARLAMTDGILILRRMLGLTGNALIGGATHACAPRSAAGVTQAIALAAYDIDGDGQTNAATDGLLLLRAMLGFRGDALIAGALGANATRRTANDIQNFLSGSCGYSFN
jgi:hypothetical protein